MAWFVLGRRPMKHCIALSLTLLFSLPAAAGPDPKSSPASDEIILAQGQISGLEKKLANPADWVTDRTARENARTSIQSVDNAVARIKKADPSWDVRAWQKLLATAQARLAAADKALAGAADEVERAEKAYYQFRSATSNVMGGLELVSQTANDPSSVKAVSAQLFAKLAPEIVALDQLAAVCRETGVATLKTPPSYVGMKPTPADACKLAADRVELGKHYAQLQLAAGVAYQVGLLQKAIENVRNGERIDANRHATLVDPKQNVDHIHHDYDVGLAVLGATLDPKDLDVFAKTAAEYPAALADAVRTLRWDKAAKLSDAGIAAAVKKDHAKGGFVEGVVIKVGSFADWSVEKNDFGVPIKRQRDAMVLVQVKGESYCRLYSRAFEATYNGGSFGKPFSRGGEAAFTISGCK